MNTKHNSIFRAAGQARRLLLVGAVTLAVFASVIIFAPAKAWADVGQYLFSDFKSGADGQFDARLGTGGTGNADSFTFYTTDVAAAIGGWSGGFVTLTECDNDATSESSGSAPNCVNRVRHSVGDGTGGFINAVGNFVTITFPSSIALNSSKYYIFAYYLGSGSFDSDSVYGINTGSCYGTVSFLGTSCALGLTQVYWDLQGTATGLSYGFSPVVGFNPRIITVYPENGTTTPTNTVVLGADVFNDSADFLRVSLRNLDTSFAYVPFDIPFFASGMISVSTTTTLASGLYLASYQMVGTSTSVTTVVNTTFRVVSSVWSEAISYDPSLIAASTTSAICSDDEVASSSPFVLPFLQFGCWALIPDPSSIANFTNLPSLLQNKVPFAYFYDVRTLLASSSQSSASTSIGTVDFFFLNATYTVFSIDNTRSFLSESIWSFIRTVVLYVLYVEWLYLMYRRVIGLLPQANK